MTKPVDYTQYTLSGLLGLYNDAAAALGRARVNKFADRKTAERRTAAIREERAKGPSALDALREAEPELVVQVEKDHGLGHHGPKDRDRLPKTLSERVAEKDAGVSHKSQGSTYRPVSAVEAEAVDTIPGMGPGVIIRSPASQAAIAASPDKTPTPPPAAKSERWRAPKKWPAAKVAYRPRPGSLQAQVYELLTANPAPTFEYVSETMKVRVKPGVKNWDLASLWSNLTYTLASGHGYGVEFDGVRVWLIVPKDERPAKTKAGPSAEQKAANAAALGALAKTVGA